MSVASNGDIGERVIFFISEYLSVPKKNITMDTSLFYDLGVDGDDAREFINSYSREFGVSLNEFEFDSYFGPEQSSSVMRIFLSIFKREKLNDVKNLKVRDLVDAAKLEKPLQ